MLNPFQRRDDPHMLVVGMTGVKMGDRVVQIGCAHGGRLAAIAGKVGLSGQAMVVVPDEESAARARTGAARAGVLVDVEVASLRKLPTDSDAFDLAVLDDTGGLFGAMRAEDRIAAIREVRRAVRPGGRAMVIATVPRGGFGALFTRAQSGPGFDEEKALQAEGFKSVRRLAERDGLRFTEGIKPRHG